jgi:hypothetical protein
VKKEAIEESATCEKKKAAVVLLFWENFYCSGSSGDKRTFGATEEET